MGFTTRPRAVYPAAGVLALALVSGVMFAASVTNPAQAPLELELRASSQRIRVWDCLLLKYTIRNNTAEAVTPTGPTEYMYGKVTIELRREPETDWQPYRSIMAKVFECGSLGSGRPVAPGTARTDVADLFYIWNDQEQPVFGVPGVYYLRACIRFQHHGDVKSEPIRIEVADIPAEQRLLIERDRRAFTSAVYGGFIDTNDLDGMYKLEGQLSRCESSLLLRCHIQILEQFRKSGFRMNADCKRLFVRLRQERGDIMTDFCILNHAIDFCNKKQWGDAEALLSTVPEHATQR